MAGTSLSAGHSSAYPSSTIPERLVWHKSRGSTEMPFICFINTYKHNIPRRRHLAVQALLVVLHSHSSSLPGVDKDFLLYATFSFLYSYINNSMHIIYSRTPNLCLTCSQKEGKHLQFCSPEHISTHNIYSPFVIGLS